MKFQYTYIVFFLLISLFACKSTEKISDNESSETIQEVSEKDRIRNANLYYEGIKYKNLGDLGQAGAFFTKAIQHDQYDAASMYELSKILLEQGDMMQALSYAEETVNIDNDNDWYKLNLSNIYKLSGNIDECIEVLKKLVKKNPNNLEFLNDLAFTYILIDEFKSSIDILNIIENKMGMDEQISVQKEKLYLRMGKTDSAINEIELLINEFPYEARYYEILAELCLNHDRKNKGLSAYLKVAEIEPDNAYIHISLSDYYRNNGQMDLAYQELKEGFLNPNLDAPTKLQLLLSFYTVEDLYGKKNNDALELINILSETHPSDARVLAIKGDLLYRAQKFEEARVFIRAIVKMDNAQYLSWEQLLIIESELQDYQAMADESIQAIELFPQQPLPYLLAGLAHFQLKDFKKALEFYNSGRKFVISNNALMAQFYSYIGDSHHELGDHTLSDSNYEKAIEMDSINPVVLNNYAYYLSEREERLNVADEMSAKAVRMDTENSSNLDTRAWVLYKLERYQEALPLIEKALEIDKGNSAVLLEHYGDILYKMGETKKAIQNWEKAKEKGGGSSLLEQKVKEGKLYE